MQTTHNTGIFNYKTATITFYPNGYNEVGAPNGEATVYSQKPGEKRGEFFQRVQCTAPGDLGFEWVNIEYGSLYKCELYKGEVLVAEFEQTTNRTFNDWKHKTAIAILHPKGETLRGYVDGEERLGNF